MRWIFFSLLIANFIAGVWGMLQPEGRASHAVSHTESKYAFEGVPALVMLSEVSVEPGIALSERVISEIPVLPTAEGAEEDEGRRLCEILGPFDGELGASEMVERLRALDVHSEVRTLQLPAGPGYWVYLEPEPNRKAALRKLAELQSRGVDSYVIPKGDVENGISLGMFSKKELADSRMAEAERMGLQPRMQTIERTYREVWVMLNHQEDEKMSEISWSRVLEDKKMLQRRENFCLDVAS